jgi:hypothetical protein
MSEAFKITPDFETILEILWKKCNPFLKDLIKPGWNGDFLYSGRGDHKDVIMIKKVRDNRRPKDMNPELSTMFDEMFYKKFGFHARSNAIFCTGNYNDAIRYGNVYMIFPVGKYKFIYSNMIRDLYPESNIIDINGKDEWIKNKLNTYTNATGDEFREDWEYYYGKGSEGGHWEYHSFYGNIKNIDAVDEEDAVWYVKDKLSGEVDLEDYEIYNGLEWVPDIKFEDYINKNKDKVLSDYKKDLEDEWEEEIRDELQWRVDSYTDDSIINAIKSKNEIMLNAKYYIALREDKYSDALRSYYKQFGYSEPKNLKIRKWYKQNQGRVPKQLSLFKNQTHQ